MLSYRILLFIYVQWQEYIFIYIWMTLRISIGWSPRQLFSQDHHLPERLAGTVFTARRTGTQPPSVYLVVGHRKHGSCLNMGFGVKNPAWKCHFFNGTSYPPIFKSSGLEFLLEPTSPHLLYCTTFCSGKMAMSRVFADLASFFSEAIKESIVKRKRPFFLPTNPTKWCQPLSSPIVFIVATLHIHI